MTIGRKLREFIELDKNNISEENYDNSFRQIEAADTFVDALPAEACDKDRHA